MTAKAAKPKPPLLDFSAPFEQHTPILPPEELRPFITHFFERRQEFIDLAEKKAPPLYVLEPEILRQRSQQFQAAFRRYLEPVSFYFAVKSNNHPEVAGTLLQTGVGLDVSSGLELKMALQLGTDRIIFSGPGKTDAELRLAVREAARLTVLVDSFAELDRLAQFAATDNRQVRIGVRLCTNLRGLWRKFGIAPEQLSVFLQKAAAHRHLQFTGLQFHTSWNLNPSAHVEFLASLGAVLAQLPLALRQQIQFIDIGGGFWVPRGEWLQEAGTEAGIRRTAFGLSPGKNMKHYRLPAVTIEVFAEEIGRAVQAHIQPLLPNCRICCEPGRWLCNDAMHLLLTVIDKKGDDLVITDAGTNTVGWERFESDYFPILNLSRPALVERHCDILGALCTPHDVWGYNYWGEDIQPGDLLLIPTQGAYTYSLRQNFIKPLPEVAVLDNGGQPANRDKEKP